MGRPKSKGLSVKEKILLAIFALTAIVFNKVAILLAIGMMPTIIVQFIDRSPERTKILTIGFMNFAGCFPFCMDILLKQGDLPTILMNPVNIIIMFGSAALGRLIEWGVVGFVAGLMVQKGRARLIDIKKTQEALVKKWGPEVTGEMPLDEYGFPLELNNK